ncbi:twin-arginine translocation signal domain-containing protein [Gimesia fumaroli]|uniref:Uncharacterized protein n=1 Tax=Gimesia fumaroli TaxID=2527976 RepID=A0A518IA21_9PLAN|nr:twin-arginine translocation signal domain-containing protein [Gimesia fumaroli]QDV49842.1 hypothetical protein Enr17x_18630 [Gimesia fumaroli]
MSDANLPDSLSRRDVLKLGAAAMAGSAGLNWLSPNASAAETKRPQVAAIYTQFFFARTRIIFCIPSSGRICLMGRSSTRSVMCFLFMAISLPTVISLAALRKSMTFQFINRDFPYGSA